MFSQLRASLDLNLHPVVKYNMVLFLGSMDATTRESASVPATPYPPATDLLLQIVDDPMRDDQLKIAAWVGLKRHVQLGLPDAKKAEVLALAQKHGAPPTGQASVAQKWIQRQAAEVAQTLQSG
jgi:hypothetical protein